MRIGNRHPNVQTVDYSDFTGGLNTTNAATMIGQTDLAQAVNVEVDKSTGLLKTCCGTNAIYTNSNMVFDYLMYDPIGNNLLVTDSDRKIYSVAKDSAGVYSLSYVGTLSGTGSVEYVAWEDGIVIASGGRLQYFHEGTIETIEDEKSPTECHCPMIKDGRIYLGIGDEIHCSAVGDEHGWINDTNDSSSSQWLQIGYKDGGKITGISSLSSDIVVYKDNHRAYHLAGSFPDWSLAEIGRSIDCKGFNCCVSLANTALTLGTNNLQSIQVTDQYGDMKASTISTKVANKIEDMANIRMRYIPSYNQVWLINGLAKFLFLEVAYGGFYQRQFMSNVVDVVEAAGNIYILKQHGLYVLSSDTMYDEGEPMIWKLQGKTLIGNNEYLIKRLMVDTTPYFYNYCESVFQADKAWVNGAVPISALCIYHDYTKVYRSKRSLHNSKRLPTYSNSEDIYHNREFVYGSDTYIKAVAMYRSQIRQVDRNRSVKIQASGAGGMQMINRISFDVAEV